MIWFLELIAAYEARWLEECRLHAGVHQIFQESKAHGLSHSILSAAHQKALEIGTTHFGIEHYFDNLLGTNNIYAYGKVLRAKQWIEQCPWEKEEILLARSYLGWQSKSIFDQFLEKIIIIF